MIPSDQTVVAVSVADPPARARLARAIAAEGLQALEISPEELTGEGRSFAACAALVYDLEPPTAESVGLVRAVRAARPWLPVLLYPPLREGVLELMLEAGRIGGVQAKEQASGSAEPERLRVLLRRTIDSAPSSRVAGIVMLLLRDAPARLIAFARAGVLSLMQADADHTVAGVGRVLGLTPRTLQRAWYGRDFPQPKELLDWLGLILVAHMATWSGESIRTISRTLGMSPNTFYRLRRRLIPDAPRPDPEHVEHELDLALLAFAERCRVPRRRAAAIKARALG